MKWFRFPVVPSVLALAAAALIARPAPAITFGEPDSKNRFPNVGAIVVVAGPNSPRVVGSGVLIHPRVLLTAGHVTASAEALIEQGVPLFNVTAVSFGTDAFDPSSWLEAVAVMTHPGYSSDPETVNIQDVGVVILKEPVDLPCATLAYEGLLDDVKATGLLVNQGTPTRFLAVGYGQTLDFPPPQAVPSDGLRRFSFPEYRALLAGWLVLNQNPAAENSGVSAGDSGGPVFWLAPDGTLVLVAIHSHVDPKRVAYSFAYRTDTAKALGFIDFVSAMVEVGLFD